jgi:hypothetical protein
MERRPGEARSGMSGGRESKHLPPVVVGVDGSAGSREALQWAIAEARLRENSESTTSCQQPSLCRSPREARDRNLESTFQRISGASALGADAAGYRCSEGVRSAGLG